MLAQTCKFIKMCPHWRVPSNYIYAYRYGNNLSVHRSVHSQAIRCSDVCRYLFIVHVLAVVNVFRHICLFNDDFVWLFFYGWHVFFRYNDTYFLLPMLLEFSNVNFLLIKVFGLLHFVKFLCVPVGSLYVLFNLSLRVCNIFPTDVLKCTIELKLNFYCIFSRRFFVFCLILFLNVHPLESSNFFFIFNGK